MSKFLPSRRSELGLEPSPPFTAPQLTLIRSGTWATEVEVFTLSFLNIAHHSVLVQTWEADLTRSRSPGLGFLRQELHVTVPTEPLKLASLK